MASLEDVLKLAKEKLASGDANGACALYQQVLERAPNNSDALFGSLQAAIATGDRARIVPAQKRLAQAHLDFAKTQYHNAIAAIGQAETAVNRAAALDPALEDVTATAWKIGRALGNLLQYFSQFGQDWYLNEQVFKNARGGIFVDVGAYDGISGSNTLFYEKFLGWSGLCIEPDPAQFEKLAGLRSCACVRACIADRDGTAEFVSVTEGLTMMGGLAEHYDPADVKALSERSKIARVEMHVRRLESVLDENGIDRIDYLSIDTEGSELAILKAFDLARFSVRALSVENNRNAPSIGDHLASAGYHKLIRLGVDDLYVRG